MSETLTMNPAFAEMLKQYLVDTRKFVPPEEKIIILALVFNGWESPTGPLLVDDVFENCPDDALSFVKLHGITIRDWFRAMKQVWEAAKTLDELVFTSAVEQSGLTEFTRDRIGALWLDATFHGWSYSQHIVRGAIDILVARRNEQIIAEATDGLKGSRDD